MMNELLAAVLAVMPVPVGRALPTDLTALDRFAADERPANFRIRLDVDPRGRPVACDAGAAEPSLGRRVCAYLVTRARFTPARDATGAAIAAIVRLDLSLNSGGAGHGRTIDFAVPVERLPGGGSLAVADVRLTTDAAGRVTACDVARSSGSGVLDRLACRQMTATTFGPGRDGRSAAVVALREVSVGLTAAPVPQ